MKLPRAIELGREVYSEWQADGGSRLGAALAYYTFFSLAPLIIILIAIVGLVFGEQAARGEVFRQIRDFIGPDAASAIQRVVARANRPAAGTLAAIVGTATLVLGAAASVTEMQGALNHIWKAKPPSGVWPVVRKRLLSIGLVLGVGFLLLVSLALNAAVTAAGSYFGDLVGARHVAIQWGNTLVSLGIITLLFAAIFKWLPDARVAWREVWLGAGVTACLFTVGKYLLGMYLGRRMVSPYGAAGSLVLVLLWVYYSAQILYLGAEFTKVHAARADRGARGARQEPTRVHPAWLKERRSGHERRRLSRGGPDRRARPHGLPGPAS